MLKLYTAAIIVLFCSMLAGLSGGYLMATLAQVLPFEFIWGCSGFFIGIIYFLMVVWEE